MMTGSIANSKRRSAVTQGASRVSVDLIRRLWQRAITADSCLPLPTEVLPDANCVADAIVGSRDVKRQDG
jgi:hypothetical protein